MEDAKERKRSFRFFLIKLSRIGEPSSLFSSRSLCSLFIIGVRYMRWRYINGEERCIEYLNTFLRFGLLIFLQRAISMKTRHENRRRIDRRIQSAIRMRVCTARSFVRSCLVSFSLAVISWLVKIYRLFENCAFHPVRCYPLFFLCPFLSPKRSHGSRATR